MTLPIVSTLKDEQASAFALLLVVLSKYAGEEPGKGLVMTWEPEILRDELRFDFGINISELQSDKIQAAITLLTTNMYEQDWRCFEFINHIFCNNLVDAEDHHPLEAEELAAGLAHATSILTDDEARLNAWHDDVRAYAGQVFWNYGLHAPPDIFPSAIMPVSPPVADEEIAKEKNAVLTDLFQAHTKKIQAYVEKLFLNA